MTKSWLGSLIHQHSHLDNDALRAMIEYVKRHDDHLPQVDVDFEIADRDAILSVTEMNFRPIRLSDFSSEHELTDQDIARIKHSTKIHCVLEQIKNQKRIVANEENMLKQLYNKLDKLKEEGLQL